MRVGVLHPSGFLLFLYVTRGRSRVVDDAIAIAVANMIVLMQFCISTTIFTMILKFCQIEVLGGTRSTNEKKSEFFPLKNCLFKFSKIDFFITTGPIGVKF